MTDKPTPTTDLLKRCAEIHEWRSTGVLSGEALRDYAKRKWPGRLDTLQMAEHETVTEALALLAKWGTPQPVVREPLTCEWTHNDDDGYWDTSCGKAWRFDDGGPKENNMNFCHCCGKTLRIKGGQHGTDRANLRLSRM